MKNWDHDHNDCKTTQAPPKVYDPTTRRYAIHDFKSQRYVEALTGTEIKAEARCIELSRSWGGKHNFFYRMTP